MKIDCAESAGDENRPANRPAFGGTVPLFYQMSRVPLNHGNVPLLYEVGFFFCARAICNRPPTVPRPNRRATVY